MASGSYLLGRDRPKCLRSQTGNVAGHRAERSASGCYMVEQLTMTKEELRVPLAARMKSPVGGQCSAWRYCALSQVPSSRPVCCPQSH